MSQAKTDAVTPSSDGVGYGSTNYRGYVLAALFVVYTFNFIDRTLISVLNDPIRETFGLSDTMMGLLAGPVFALLYTLLGIPIGMMSERFNRVSIISIAMALWSLMTALCGMAQTTLQLILARIGVGVGEAGCSPPAHSLISDYFPPAKRATALSIYSVGIPVGSMLSGLAGAWIAEEVSWRYAFLLLGLPGIALAIIFKLTVKEPPRGYSDPNKVTTKAPHPFAAFKAVSQKWAFWNVVLGGGLASFVGYGIGQFMAPFWVRLHGMSLKEASLIYALVLGLAAALGTFVSGYFADKLRDKYPSALCWIPAIGFVIATPTYIIGLNTTMIAEAGSFMAIAVALPFFIIAAITHYFYLGPMFAINQSLVEPRMRATAAALLIFFINIIGYVCGPPIIGWISDIAAQMDLANASETVRQLFVSAGVEIDQMRNYCNTNRIELRGTEIGNACAQADGKGLQTAMSVGVLIYLWAGIHYLLIAKTWKREAYIG